MEAHYVIKIVSKKLSRVNICWKERCTDKAVRSIYNNCLNYTIIILEKCSSPFNWIMSYIIGCHTAIDVGIKFNLSCFEHPTYNHEKLYITTKCFTKIENTCSSVMYGEWSREAFKQRWKQGGWGTLKLGPYMCDI